MIETTINEAVSQPTLNEILRTAPNICIKPTETNHHRMRNNLLSSDDICFTGMLSKEELYGALERKENLFYSEFFACAFLLVFIFLRFTSFLLFLLMIFSHFLLIIFFLAIFSLVIFLSCFFLYAILCCFYKLLCLWFFAPTFNFSSVYFSSDANLFFL